MLDTIRLYVTFKVQRFITEKGERRSLTIQLKELQIISCKGFEFDQVNVNNESKSLSGNLSLHQTNWPGEVRRYLISVKDGVHLPTNLNMKSSLAVLFSSRKLLGSK